jgi:hypothetical protein
MMVVFSWKRGIVYGYGGGSILYKILIVMVMARVGCDCHWPR